MPIVFIELIGAASAEDGEIQLRPRGPRLVLGDPGPDEGMIVLDAWGGVELGELDTLRMRARGVLDMLEGDAITLAGAGGVQLVEDDISPDIGVIDATTYPILSMLGYDRDFGEFELEAAGGVFLADPAADMGVMAMAGRGGVFLTDNADNFDFSTFLVQSPGFLYGTSGFERLAIYDVLALGAEIDSQTRFTISEGLGFTHQTATVIEVLRTLTSGVGMADQLSAIWRVLQEDGIAFDASAEASQIRIVQLIESLALTLGFEHRLEARNIVAAALGLNDALAVLNKEQISDQAAFNAALSATMTAKMRVVDALAVSAVLDATATFTMLVADTVQLNDTVTSTAEVSNIIRENLGVSLTFRIGDSVYAAWVCNTASKAFSSYENYPFNSFFEFDQRDYFGCAPDGIYELVGNSDDGDPINARIRTGLSTLGTARMKRLEQCYLGIATDGDMYLKVIVTSTTDGEKEAWWYRFAPTNGSANTREGRVKIGKGLKSVYYAFEIANIDGANFDLDNMQLLPIILDRRIDGGTN